MSNTVSDLIVDRLSNWGVQTIYGYPGDGINGVVGALNRARESNHGPRFIQARHEELAAFMACGHAKFSGEVGVCLATSGPGAVHLLNGLYDAAKDNVPVVAIVGQQPRTGLGSDSHQELDLNALFKDVAHHFVQTCTHPAQARHLVDQAMRVAKAQRSVTCVILPTDIQQAPAVPSPKREHGRVFSGIGFPRSRVIPEERELERAAQLLNSAERPAVLIGSGAANAAAEVTKTAELMGAGIAKALLGKDVLADDISYVTGAVGLLGTEPSHFMLSRCDTLLMIGTSFPYAEWLPPEGQARAVQIDINPNKLSLRYPCEVNLYGDARETLTALLPHLRPTQNRSWREEIESRVEEWWKLLEARAMQDAKPINPQRVFWELSKRLPDGCVITADSGSVVNWYARDLKFRAGMRGSLSGGLATMCPAIPYALAAKFSDPSRPVVACIGDGAMQMLGMNALLTVAQHYRDWLDRRLVVLVLNNGDLNHVTWEQRVMLGEPRSAEALDLPDFSHASFAEIAGLKAVRITELDQLEPGLDQAFSAREPCVVEVYTDPEVPFLPPHINAAQAMNYWRSLLGGEANPSHMLHQSLKDMFA